MDATMFIKLIAKLLIVIFQKFEVDKEFEAIGVDVISLLNALSEKE